MVSRGRKYRNPLIMSGRNLSEPNIRLDLTQREEMEMSEKNSLVVVYGSHSNAEAAIKELQKSGFDIKKLSILGKEYHTEEHVVGYYNAGDRMKYWGKMGAFWGGVWGLLVGAAFFVIPGVGPVLIAGPLVAWVVSALEGAVVVGGLSALGAGLYSVGIPKDSILRYETAIQADKFLLVVHGSADEMMKAKNLLKITSPEESNIHFVDEAVLTNAS
jgi:Heat induced stress protein YflT domain